MKSLLKNRNITSWFLIIFGLLLFLLFSYLLIITNFESWLFIVGWIPSTIAIWAGVISATMEDTKDNLEDILDSNIN